MQPVSDYILSEHNLFSPAIIAKESFVPLRNEDVRLSYVIGEELGEGGYGVVYRAVCRQSGAVRAAKMLKRARLPSEELRKVEN
jgi:serine/threonine protein kinase